MNLSKSLNLLVYSLISKTTMFDEITHYKPFKGKDFRAKQKLYQELCGFQTEDRRR